MDNLLAGFSDELVKLAGSSGFTAKERREYQQLYKQVKKKSQRGYSDSSLKKLRGQGRRVSRDYLASAALGSIGTPAAMLLGRKLTKTVRNRDIIRAMSRTSSKRRRRQLAHGLETRDLVGRGGGIGLPHKKDPILSHADLIGGAARGGVAGSVFQMLRDRFAGSAGYKQK